MKFRLDQGHTAGVCDAPDQRILYEINGDSEIFRGIEGAVCSIISPLSRVASWTDCLLRSCS